MYIIYDIPYRDIWYYVLCTEYIIYLSYIFCIHLKVHKLFSYYLRMTSLSPSTALEEMKRLFKDIPSPPFLELDDSTFLRYLRARQFDVPKASDMLKESIKVRSRIIIP